MNNLYTGTKLSNKYKLINKLLNNSKKSNNELSNEEALKIIYTKIPMLKRFTFIDKNDIDIGMHIVCIPLDCSGIKNGGRVIRIFKSRSIIDNNEIIEKILLRGQQWFYKINPNKYYIFCKEKYEAGILEFEELGEDYHKYNDFLQDQINIYKENKK